MRSYRALNLNHRISIKSFCDTLIANLNSTSYKADIYHRFSRASRIHRYVAGQMEISNLNPSTPSRVSCPACRSNPGGVSSCVVDACMSFQGKGDKSAAVSPIYGTMYIEKDISKKEVMDDKKYKPPDDAGCDSNFRAAEGAYISGKNYHQGISGTICKHRIPGHFMFLVHGKEAYIFAQKHLHRELSKANVKKLLFKYDLGCKFARYLKVEPI